jgi:L-ribulose-5-phosphate 3-epimerase
MDLNRISACTYAIREQPLDVALDILSGAGVSKADLWGGPPNFSVQSTLCNIDKVKAQAAEKGIVIANIGSYPGFAFTSEDPLVLDAEVAVLKATLHVAKAFGARSIRVMAGHGEDPALVEKVAPLFAQATPVAEQLGVYMGIENHGGAISKFPDLLARLFNIVGSPNFGVLYEPSNLMEQGVEYKQAFDTMRDHIVHVHCKDGRRNAEGKWQRCHLGEGELDYGWIIESIESVGYAGDYALEYEIEDIEPMETGLKKWVETFRAV